MKSVGGSSVRQAGARLGWWLATAIACLLVLLVGASAAAAAAVNVCPSGETTSVHNSGDAADDDAIWIHPSNPALSTIIGTDKSVAGGLNVYDLSGNELFFKNDGRLNNDDVRYNFPLGSSRVALVGATNRLTLSLDFYKVNESDRSLTKVGSVHLAAGTKIVTPRGFAFYHSPVSGKYYAFVTDIGHTEQYELDGSSGQVTGTRVRVLQDTPVLHTEGLVADDELGRVYLAEEDIGGIWRFGAEPGDPATGVKIATTTEVGGHIVQDVKGLLMYFASGGRGYLIAISQGGNSFHVFNRGDNAWVGEFKVVACNGIDAVTGIDGADVTNFNLGGQYAQGMFVTQDTANDTGNQNHKLVAWQNIANAFNPPLIIDTTWDPRAIGASTGGTDTAIVSGPSGATNSSSATFSFSATVAGSTFQCALDAAAFSACTSPTTYSALAEGAHTFQVRATDPSNNTDPTPASRAWTVDITPPQVTTTSPADIAAGVAIDANIQATFNEAMDPATIANVTVAVVTTSDSSAIPAAVTYDAATKTATLNPTSDLATSTGYTATVSTAAKDLAGNPLATATTWTFTTAAAPPPPPPPPTGAITRQTTSTVVNTTATNVVTVPRPSGTAAGDVLVGCLTLNGGSVSGLGVPFGWAPIASVTAISNPHIFGYYRVAGASEPASYAWTLTSAVVNGAGIARYAGVDTTNPLDTAVATATGATSTSGTVLGVTTVTANAMVVGCMGLNTSSTTVTITSPAGMNEAWDIGGKRHELADGTQAAAGASGPKTWTFSATREWAGWLTALRPQSGPPSLPVNSVLPSVCSAPAVGVACGATNGTWSGAPSFAYQWQTNPVASGGTWTDATGVGKNSASYTPASSDATKFLRVVVTATNGGGSASALSAASAAAVVVSTVPAGTVALWHMDEPPGSTSMNDAVGPHTGTLRSVTAGVAGSLNTAYGFNGSSSDVSVPDATDLNPGSTDITITIHLKTTSAPATPDWDLIRKGYFTGSPGEYKMEYQPSGQVSCGFKGSAGYSELVAGPSLKDGAWHTVRCVKTATSIAVVVDGTSFSQAANVGLITNSNPVVIGARPGSEFFNGSLDEASIAIGTATTPPPTNLTPPTVCGAPTVGAPCTGNQGTWSGASGFTYQWQTSTGSDPDGLWNPASGPTAATLNYTPVAPADVGLFLRLVVTVSTGSGPVSAQSAASAAAVVNVPLPVNSVVPVVCSAPGVGVACVGAAGSWSGATGALVYQWQVNTSASATTGWVNGTGVGATSLTYTPAASDATKFLRVVETASNSVGGQASATSLVSGTVAPASSGIARATTSTVVNSTATSVVTVPAPSQTQQGDVLVACLGLNGGGVAATGVPAGWTLLASVTAIVNPHVFGYYRVAGASETASYSWTLTSAVANSGGIARYAGVNGTTPLAATVSTATGASATSAAVPGVTTATANAVIVGCMAANSSAATLTITSPAGMTEAWDIAGKRQELADGLQSAAGASGAKTWTFSASREWAGWLTALRPQ